MKLTLYTEDFFDAAHYLNDYNGKCSNMHGHTWKVCIWVSGDEEDLDKSGILWDFTKLKTYVKEFDHKILNELLDFNPTAENLSLFVFKKVKKDKPNLNFKVRVYENFTSRHSFCETGDLKISE